jgi:putative intracellular protease/amidase
MRPRVLLPLPDRGFDLTETAVPWRLLTDGGCDVVFATERGFGPPACDPRTRDGALFHLFGAARDAQHFYRDLERAPAFRRPLAWSALDPAAFDGLFLPGGHAPGMRQYLGSASLQQRVANFWSLDRPVAAICHGVLVLARSRDAATGKSPIARARTTCLPKYVERGAYLATAWKLGRYYRTYDAYVEDEVRAALDDPARQLERGPIALDPRRVVAASETAFVVEDGRYLSARWPGDAALLARKFLALLQAAAARAA